ncbi:hypothetical protein SNE40_016638 [Patella caerulea]|uniref:Uncharacterized protein n=2 Tax=Patella caerulea TaxID=87958 RepID=A0AAN8JEJ4_PATCE
MSNRSKQNVFIVIILMMFSLIGGYWYFGILPGYKWKLVSPYAVFPNKELNKSFESKLMTHIIPVRTESRTSEDLHHIPARTESRTSGDLRPIPARTESRTSEDLQHNSMRTESKSSEDLQHIPARTESAENRTVEVIQRVPTRTKYNESRFSEKKDLHQTATNHKIHKQEKTGLILFTSWVDTKEKSLVHMNVMNSWKFWKLLVKPLFFYSNKTTGDRMKKSGWLTLPVSNTACGTSKIPVIRDMFLDAMKNYDSPLYGYANGDITFDEGISTSIKFLSENAIIREKPVMILIRRTNVDFTNGPLLNRSSNFTEIRLRGKVLNDGSSDGFFTNTLFPWKYIPDIVIGRMGIAMWLVSYARAVNATLIEISKTVQVIHMTTKSGNYESHSTQNVYCNHELYKKFNAYPTTWGCGHIHCASLELKADKNGNIILKKKSKNEITEGCYNCSMNLMNVLPKSYGKQAYPDFTV